MNNQAIITIDSETAPSMDPAVHEQIGAAIKPPGSMKKPETIAAWIAEEKPAAIHEAILKTALDGTYGHLAVIGAAFNDEEPVAFWKPGTDPSVHEADILKEFFYWLKQVYQPSRMRLPVFVGHNHVGFDLPFMFKRAVILGIQPPPFIPFHAKPWDAQVHDNMVAWAGTRDYVSQDKVSRVLGGMGKGEIDGSQVWPLIAEGRIAEVAEYCKDDVRDARHNYKRMTFQTTLGVEIDDSKPFAA